MGVGEFLPPPEFWLTAWRLIEYGILLLLAASFVGFSIGAGILAARSVLKETDPKERG